MREEWWAAKACLVNLGQEEAAPLSESGGVGGETTCSLDSSALASENPNLLFSSEEVLQSLRNLGLGQAICMFTVQAMIFDPGTWCCFANLTIISKSRGSELTSQETLGEVDALSSMGPSQL